jgi:hypothetical protein
MNRSIPIAKALDDAMIALYQNGERLSPSNGYPMRILVPGYEGTLGPSAPSASSHFAFGSMPVSSSKVERRTHERCAHAAPSAQRHNHAERPAFRSLAHRIS